LIQSVAHAADALAFLVVPYLELMSSRLYLT
jgi:hypothetical protein